MDAYSVEWLPGVRTDMVMYADDLNGRFAGFIPGLGREVGIFHTCGWSIHVLVL